MATITVTIDQIRVGDIMSDPGGPLTITGVSTTKNGVVLDVQDAIGAFRATWLFNADVLAEITR